MTPLPHIRVGGWYSTFVMTSGLLVSDVITVDKSHIELIPRLLKSQGRNGAADTVVVYLVSSQSGRQCCNNQNIGAKCFIIIFDKVILGINLLM